MNFEPKPPFDADVTQILRRAAPGWAWARKNFSLPALLTMATMLAGFGGYLISLQTEVTALKQQVVIIREIAPDSKALAVLTQRVNDHDRRLADIEGTLTVAVENSQTPIAAQHRGKRKP